MQAFIDTPITKEELLTELRWHQEQDNFIKGKYFKDGKGCAVGCSLESLARKKDLKINYGDHGEYENKFGIPRWLAHLEDRIFEGVNKDRSKVWPVEFMDAINVGADLNKIKVPFLLIVLKSALESFDHEKFPQVKEAIIRVQNLYESGETDLEKFKDAAAYGAAYAARAAYAAAAAYGAAAAAYGAKFEYFADELLRLIRECK